MFTDAELIASFDSETRIANRQYEVLFGEGRGLGNLSYTMSVWADNKKEANVLAREYATRIMQKSFSWIRVA